MITAKKIYVKEGMKNIVRNIAIFYHTLSFIFLCLIMFADICQKER